MDPGPAESSPIFNFANIPATDDSAYTKVRQEQDEQYFHDMRGKLTPAIPSGYTSQIKVQKDHCIKVQDVIDAFDVANKFNLHETWHYCMPGGFLNLLREGLTLGFDTMVPANVKLGTTDKSGLTISFSDLALICKFEDTQFTVWEKSIFITPSGTKRKAGDDDAPPPPPPKEYKMINFDLIQLSQDDIRLCVFRELAEIKNHKFPTISHCQKAATLLTFYCCAQDQDVRKAGVYLSQKMFYTRSCMHFCMRFPSRHAWLGCIEEKNLISARQNANLGAGHRITVVRPPRRATVTKDEQPSYDMIKFVVMGLYTNLLQLCSSENTLDTMIYDQKGLLLGQLVNASIHPAHLQEFTYTVFHNFEWMETLSTQIRDIKGLAGHYTAFANNSVHKFAAQITALTNIAQRCQYPEDKVDILAQIKSTIRKGTIYPFCRKEVPPSKANSFNIKGPLGSCIMSGVTKTLKDKDDLMVNTPFVAHLKSNQNKVCVLLLDETGKLYQYSFYPFRPTHVSFFVKAASFDPTKITDPKVYYKFMHFLQEESPGFCNTNKLHQWTIEVMQCTLPLFIREVYSKIPDATTARDLVNYLTTYDTSNMDWLSESAKVKDATWRNLSNHLMCNCLELMINSKNYTGLGVFTIKYDWFKDGGKGTLYVRANMHMMVRNLAVFDEEGFRTETESAFKKF